MFCFLYEILHPHFSHTELNILHNCFVGEFILFLNRSGERGKLLWLIVDYFDHEKLKICMDKKLQNYEPLNKIGVKCRNKRLKIKLSI